LPRSKAISASPRWTAKLLAAHARGIIATNGCVSGEVQTRLRLGQYAEAVAAAADYRDIFGPDTSSSRSWTTAWTSRRGSRDGLARVARDLSLPFVVTNDSHYTRRTAPTPHEVLLAVQTGTTLADPTRFRFEGTGYYLKSPQEMRAVSTDEQWQAGCDATWR